jgi:DNA repair exonuclease SbcCD nuclease subunit
MEDEVALKLVHTADWHLGRRFRSFREEDAKKLTRERLAVVGRILQLANQHQVSAVLCAGDLFDSPSPDEPWWRGLAEHLIAHGRAERPVFLLPGNHDPLKAGSVYSAEHPFRRLLPSWVHVVDRDDFSYELSKDAVLYAVPCRSAAGQDDLSLKLPPRAAGDQRIRIGLVHGQTFDIEGHQSNFPISKTAAFERGFNYLAIGDTHAFRKVDTGTAVPVVYPGAPEPAKFDETEAGNVALVFFRRPPAQPIITAEPVGRYRWLQAKCHSIEELRSVNNLPHLDATVLRLELDLSVTLTEERELTAILAELAGNDARSGRVAALQIERTRVEVNTGEFGELLPKLPSVLQATVRTLQAQADGNTDEARRATRALRHLYQLVQREVAP